MSRSLAGKTAVVTGAARGQGRAHAVRLARAGADILAIDACEDHPRICYPLASRADLEETAALVRAEGRRVYAVQADVRDQASLRAALEAAAAAPSIDIVVANAAIAAYARVLDTDPASWQAVLDVNLTGVFNTVQVFVPRIVQGRRGGAVVITGSTAGLKGLPFCGPYAAAKHGLHGLMKVLAQELGEYGIRVNTVDPGPVNTAMAADPSGPVAMSAGQDTADSRLFLASFQPLLPLPESGMLEPSAISDAIAWLVSDDARYVTGVEIPVDAGVYVR
jgi:SDR family mycofactocin-dependent oxidoreductase